MSKLRDAFDRMVRERVQKERKLPGKELNWLMMSGGGENGAFGAGVLTQTFISKCERGERRLDVVELSWWCEALSVDLTVFVQRYQEERRRSYKLD